MVVDVTNRAIVSAEDAQQNSDKRVIGIYVVLEEILSPVYYYTAHKARFAGTKDKNNVIHTDVDAYSLSPDEQQIIEYFLKEAGAKVQDLMARYARRLPFDTYLFNKVSVEWVEVPELAETDGKIIWFMLCNSFNRPLLHALTEHITNFLRFYVYHRWYALTGVADEIQLNTVAAQLEYDKIRSILFALEGRILRKVAPFMDGVWETACARPNTNLDSDSNNNIIDNNMLENIMAAIALCLKTPAFVDLESQLPPADSVENGAYYAVRNLNITKSGYKGWAWKNSAISQSGWQIVPDDFLLPDEHWIVPDANNKLTLPDDVRSLIAGAIQGAKLDEEWVTLDANGKLTLSYEAKSLINSGGGGTGVNPDHYVRTTNANLGGSSYSGNLNNLTYSYCGGYASGCEAKPDDVGGLILALNNNFSAFAQIACSSSGSVYFRKGLRESQGVPPQWSEWKRVATSDEIPEIPPPSVSPDDNSYVYGVEWDTAVSSTICTRIGNMSLHRTLPIQSMMRRCLLDEYGNVTYLDAKDSTKTATGEAADLSGAAGDVMVEIPEHYRKFETEGTLCRCLISIVPFQGCHHVAKAWRGAYEASRTAPPLGNVGDSVTVTRDYRLRSAAGVLPANGFSDYRVFISGTNGSYERITLFLENYRAQAKKDKQIHVDKWDCDLYELQKTCYWLYVVEYANFNSQLAFNAEPNAYGFKQGGLGYGVTEVEDNKPFITCGYTNSLGNETGVKPFIMTSGKMVEVPSYRGLENIFGHLMSLTAGISIGITGSSGSGYNITFTNERSGNSYSFPISAIPNGYIKTLYFGEFGENIAASVGGGSSIYLSDYMTPNNISPSSGSDPIRIFFGGYSSSGVKAGLACMEWLYEDKFIFVGNNLLNPHVGTRLCYAP